MATTTLSPGQVCFHSLPLITILNHLFFCFRKLKNLLKKFSDEDRKGLEEIVDDVYIIDHYKEQKLQFEEALALIRETHGPTIYNDPEALVEAKIELNLRTKKKTKFVERFSGIVSYSNSFEYANKRKVVAVCKTEEDSEAARAAGAEISGTSDLIRMIKIGDITMDNFDDLVCHGDMLLELATIKGLIGNFFPTKQRGNVGFDMHKLVSYFVNGHEYKLKKDNCEPDYGFVQIQFGRLSLTDQELGENFQQLLEVIETNQPASAPGKFITRVLILAKPSAEQFPVAHWNHLDGYEESSLEEETKPEEKKKASMKS